MKTKKKKKNLSRPKMTGDNVKFTRQVEGEQNPIPRTRYNIVIDEGSRISMP